jgi:hypothetical protein
MENVLLSIAEQIKTALDGRTQRWLCLRIQMPESDFSNKLKGRYQFSDDELTRIGQVLGVEIKKN